MSRVAGENGDELVWSGQGGSCQRAMVVQREHCQGTSVFTARHTKSS